MSVQTTGSKTHREAILDEMNRILSDPTFRNSKRCVTLLRYLIEHVLADEQDSIKERVLGVEVFGRKPSYDTNADPIVRMTANEVRKRLAQYYQGLDGHSNVRIRLERGGYLPEFDFEVPDQHRNEEGAETLVEPSESAATHQPRSALSPFGRLFQVFFGARLS